jgi:hypothetical protein
MNLKKVSFIPEVGTVISVDEESAEAAERCWSARFQDGYFQYRLELTIVYDGKPVTLSSTPIERSPTYIYGRLLPREEFEADSSLPHRGMLEVHPKQQKFVLYRTGYIGPYHEQDGDIFLGADAPGA